jgi:predicted nucleic acid-binding protein
MVTNAILDSSVVVALVTSEKYSDWSNSALLNHQYLHALDLSFYEVANSIRYKVSEKFDSKDAAVALRQAEKIMNLSTIHCFSEVLPEAFTKALELKIAVYDAAFLSLAEKLDAKLLTLDLKLIKKIENTKYFSLTEYPNKKTLK